MAARKPAVKKPVAKDLSAKEAVSRAAARLGLSANVAESFRDGRESAGTVVPGPRAMMFAHIVAKGETLADISRMYYGDAENVLVIYGVNIDKLFDKSDIGEGMVLNLPNVGSIGCADCGLSKLIRDTVDFSKPIPANDLPLRLLRIMNRTNYVFDEVDISRLVAAGGVTEESVRSALKFLMNAGLICETGVPRTVELSHAFHAAVSMMQ